MKSANTRTIDEYYAAQPGHRFGQPTPKLFIAGWLAALDRIQANNEEAVRQASSLAEMLGVEAAYNATTGECIGLRLSSPAARDGVVVLAYPALGLRVGDQFVPAIGEHIEYRKVALIPTHTVTDERNG